MTERDIYYDTQEPQMGCFGQMVAGFIGLLICLLISLCTSSCSRKTTSVDNEDYISVSRTAYNALTDTIDSQRVQISTLINSKEKVDSIYVEHRDSTYVYVKGDTVTITKYIHDITYKDSRESESVIQSLQDSINMFKAQSSTLQEKMDSVQNVSHTEVIEKKYIPKWMYAITSISFFVVLGLVLYLIRKFKF